MFIDKILARFKIQTKVLLFILPFVVSISAVGITGLYASGLLQGRMEISNSVLQSLSGFKDVYAGMNAFLQNTSEETRQAVVTKLETQQDVLAATLSQVVDKEGRQQLQMAVDGSTKIDDRVGQLWTLFENEVSLRKSINVSLGNLLSEQMKVLEEATKMERAVRKDEEAAKTLLREAERLTSSGDTVASLVTNFALANANTDKAAGAAAAIGVAAESYGPMSKVLRKISSALPPERKAAAETMKKTIDEIKALVDGGDKSEETAASIGKLIARFRQTSIQLNTAAVSKMKEATATFGKLDAPLVKAGAVLTDTRKLVNSVYSIRIAAASFLEKSDEEGRQRLAREFKVMEQDIQSLAGTAGDMEFFSKLVGALKPIIEKMGSDSATLVDISQKRNAEFTAAAAEIDDIWAQLTAFAEGQKTTASVERDKANQVSVMATVLGVLIALLAGGALVLTLKGPIGQITAAMRRLADGALDTSIDGGARRDEIGDMARALGIFKENALSKVRIEAESEEQRAQADAERSRNDTEKRALDSQIDFAVSQLAAGLGRLAQGDLSQQIETPFTGRLEQLRMDFNGSLIRLQDTLLQIRNNALSIQRSGNDMHASADSLSKRTEAQAASLEETAAAVDQITVTVRSSAERAHEANVAVTHTKKSADSSAVVVSSAIAAMGRIEDASHQIEQIIEVIDEIAFQTNLLALNAGIEAARAGDAGRGFAVVAQEVRELAQRSADAARQIKGLINKSTQEVNSGSQLVQETGAVLASISQQIVSVSSHVEMIATASRDQAAALHEVNGSVNQMDQMTQQNATMVDQATNASRELANQADTLMMLVDQFRLEPVSTGRQIGRAA
ncbi:HAMP domain-containing methyl-accepting chemotaxis protein [Rhizobium sp. PL01]|jgi:methyl-accepting chemotaxis protein|uniref:methyl-accepting chemotaxis protein n=1 Tax=Rhizobium sp. PL01 TaxID=3085631 RepID=UPI002980C1A8|nr:HAMP domain-containing methyl-accepting chemotaxis protein [Rhizobium sp. PL01]MDW5314019.1 HAMP domain-containing methyl-accepting chemotaxis protein [Rhizobium sp. PL01]